MSSWSQYTPPTCVCGQESTALCANITVQVVPILAVAGGQVLQGGFSVMDLVSGMEGLRRQVPLLDKLTQSVISTVLSEIFRAFFISRK